VVGGGPILKDIYHLSAHPKIYTISMCHDMGPFGPIYMTHEPIRGYTPSICGPMLMDIYHLSAHPKIYTISMCHDLGPSGVIYTVHQPDRRYIPHLYCLTWAHPKRYIPPMSPSDNIHHFYMPWLGPIQTHIYGPWAHPWIYTIHMWRKVGPC
jgi:hypothetical protein